MPIIEGFDAVLPEENTLADGSTIHKEVVYSGFALDGRTLTNADIRELYTNTKDHFLSKGIMVKVKIGHFQEGFLGDGEQELKGFVKKLELHEQPSDSRKAGLSIYADMHLYPEIATQWKEGRFPEVSIGSMGDVKDRDGNDIPQIFDHIALLGAGRAALPDSEPGQARTLLLNIYNSLKNIFNKNPIKEVENMDDKQRAEGLIATQAIEAAARALGTLFGGQEPPIKMEAPEPKAEPKKEEPKRSSTVEVTKSFQALVDGGNISPDTRAKFDSLVDNNGLEFAVSFYSDEKAETPPKNDELKSNRDESDLSEQVKLMREYARKIDPKISEKELAKLGEEGE